MSQGVGSPAELRATVGLTRREVGHLWNGGVLSLKVEGRRVEADIEIRCPEAEPDRRTRILIRRVSAD